MAEAFFQMPGGWQESFWTPQAPREVKSSSRFTNYRVSNIDAVFDESSLASSLRSTLHLSEQDELQIWSLTPSLIYPERKVATISLKRNTSLFGVGETERHVSLSCEGSESRREPVVIDTHFLGFTPLNNPGYHKFDVVAISGIGGHAFGSFRAPDGEYMWLRDKLPRHLSGARVMIYGYDSQIAGSKSFQGLGAISLTFKNHFRSVRQRPQGVTGPVPIMLIGHSMGGLIIKKAITLMAEGDEKDQIMLKSTYGILFFGVPNQGMQNSSLVAMARGQPNEALIQTLGTESEYLQELHAKFRKVFTFRSSVIFSFYETEESPTATLENGEWVMKGPTAILVGSASATQGRDWEQDSYHVQPINRTHSKMVKFKLVDQYFDIVLEKLQGFAESAIDVITERLSNIQPHTPLAQGIPLPSIVPRRSWPSNLKSSESPTEIRGQSYQAFETYQQNSTGLSQDLQNASINYFQMSVYKHISEMASSLELQRQLLAQVEARRLQEAFLQSITPSYSQHSKVIPNPLVGTCKWIFKKSQYKTWSEIDLLPQLLVIVAGTGRGKSVLAKYLASELGADEDSVILSFFCKGDSADRKTAVTVIQHLLYQLLSKRPALLRLIPNHILEKETQAKSDFQSLWEIFINIISDANAGLVYCIIDGLDECDEKSRILICDSICRDVLDSTRRSKASPQARILITSQPSPEILALGEASNLLEIMPSDVNPDIYELVNQGISKVTSNNIVSAELAEAIKAVLKERADGMFQWAALVIEDLNASNRLHSDNRILELFRTVPETLAGLYDRAFKNIATNDRIIAEKILKLLLFASRALTETELAFAFLDEDKEYQRHEQISSDLEPSIHKLAQSVCNSFLKITEEDRLLTVSHQSASLFLLGLRDPQENNAQRFLFDPNEGHLTLAKTCLRYLLLEEIRAESDTEDEEDLYVRYPFLRYAESNWNYHLEEIKDLDSISPFIQAFFNVSRPSIRAWKAAWPEFVIHFPDSEILDDCAVLHVLVNCRLTFVLMRCAFMTRDASKPIIGPDNPLLLLKTEVDAVDSRGRTPLMIFADAEDFVGIQILSLLGASHYAMDNAGCTLAHLAVLHKDAVYLSLLRHIGVDLYSADAFGRTPLSIAILVGNKTAIGILWEADPKYNGITGETALHLAAAMGDIDLVRELLILEADINRKTKKGNTFLKIAVENGNGVIVDSFLAHFANPNLADSQGCAPLHVAAAHHFPILKALLRAFASPEIRDNQGVTPLMTACRSGNIDTVKELLPLCTDLNQVDDDGQTALHHAVWAKSKTLVEILLHHGADVNLVDHYGISALHITTIEGVESIMVLLLSQENIEVDQPSKTFYRTPLYDAAKQGFENLVSLLLAHNANPEGISADGISDENETITALQGAANQGHLAVVKLLVAAGANLEAKWKGNFTPLQAAALNNHSATVTFLLESGVDPLCRNQDGISPQHYLALHAQDDNLLRILDAGGDKMWTQERVSTPLHWACRGGSEPTIRLLLKRGLDPKLRNEDGWTPLHEAAAAGHAEICTILLGLDVDIDKRNDQGRSPLHVALSNGHKAVAQVLLRRHALVESTDTRGWTPLHAASASGFGHEVQLILQKTSQINATSSHGVTPLACAVEEKHVSVARILLESGADADIANYSGDTPLHLAADVGSQELVEMLFKRTTSIDRTNNRGNTPLFFAAARGFDKIVQSFLMNGVSKRVISGASYNLLTHAAMSCKPETVRILTELGVGGLEDDLQSPLNAAVNREEDAKSLEIIKILLEHGADPNSRDMFGDTPLHVAAMTNKRKAVQILIAVGGDLGLIDCYGRTAYYWAKRPFNNYLPANSELDPPSEPSDDFRSSCLERTICQCIVRLKKSIGNPHSHYRILGKCLQFQNDLENALVAFEQRITKTDVGFDHLTPCKAPFHPHRPTAGIESVQGSLYICSSCEGVDICEACFNKQQNGEAFINGCVGHEFLIVPRPEWESLPEGIVDKDGLTVQEWLTSLRDTTEYGVDGLQVWHTKCWTRLVPCRQLCGGVWE